MAIPRASERIMLQHGGEDDTAAIAAIFAGERVYQLSRVRSKIGVDGITTRIRRASLRHLRYGIYYDRRKLPARCEQFSFREDGDAAVTVYKIHDCTDKANGAFSYHPVKRPR